MSDTSTVTMVNEETGEEYEADADAPPMLMVVWAEGDPDPITGVENMNRVRVSSLPDMEESPAHFKYYRENQKEQSPAMFMGTLTHLATMEPEAFFGQYCTAPEDLDHLPETMDELKVHARKLGITKMGSKKMDLVMAIRDFEPDFLTRTEAVARAIGSKQLLTPKQWSLVTGAAEALRKALKPFLEGALPERRLYGQIAPGDWILTGQPDIVNPTLIPRQVLIIEVKRTVSVERKRFMRQVMAMGYHIQAACYSDLAEKYYGMKPKYLWAAVQGEAPHVVGLIAPDDAVLQAGRVAYRGNIRNLRICTRENHWPGPNGDKVVTGSFEEWMFREITETFGEEDDAW